MLKQASLLVGVFVIDILLLGFDLGETFKLDPLCLDQFTCDVEVLLLYCTVASVDLVVNLRRSFSPTGSR